MISSEELFIWIFDDMTEKVAKPSIYKMIKTSALLRQLYLDERPVVHQANRNHKLKLLYTIVGPDIQMSTSASTPGTVLGVNYRMTYVPVDVKIKTHTRNENRFMNFEVVGTEGYSFKVSEVIKVIAHCYGGVHLHQPSGREKILIGLFANHKFGNISQAFLLIQSIARTTLQGLDPLYQHVKSAST
jgi:hypothetical protein